MTDPVSTTSEFPLSGRMAKQILREIVEHRSAKLKFTKHARDRMAERGVNNRQVIQVIKSSSARILEGPSQTAHGSWNVTIQGFVSGDNVRVIFDIRRCESDPTAFVVTVIAPDN
jgi:hypothetical protein